MEVILFLSKSKERTLIIYQWVEVDGGGGGKGMSVVLQSNPRILNKAFKYSYDS